MTDRPSPPAEQEARDYHVDAERAQLEDMQEARRLDEIIAFYDTPRSLALALLGAKKERDDARKLCVEMEEWLDEALAALGVDTVFQIKDAGSRALQATQEDGA